MFDPFAIEGQVIDYDNIKHGTPRGVFKIEKHYLLGVKLYALYFNEIFLADYIERITALDELFDGTHEAKLGFSPEEAGLPDDFSGWSNSVW